MVGKRRKRIQSGWRSRALAISFIFGTTVLIPFPFPSIYFHVFDEASTRDIMKRKEKKRKEKKRKEKEKEKE